MATEQTPLLKVNNIEVIYEHVILVLKGVSLDVYEGQIASLLGANGAGKSTTLKAISNLVKAERGEVTKGTVEDDLLTGAYTRGRDKKGIQEALDKVYRYFPRLKERRNAKTGYISGGEMQMCAIGRGLMAKPRIMLLDEPSMGLAPLLVEEIFNIIKRLNEEEKVGMLLAEQNAAMALNYAEYGYIMENGRVVLDGDAETLKDNADVREFYLGLTEIGKKSYRDVKHYHRRKRWLA
jgi:branched-chain amino acid transport system ATP-binding protein